MLYIIIREVAVLSTAYDSFFDRIPPRLLHIIVNGCTLGDRAFQQIIDSDPALLNSSYMKCLRTRIHDKALQKCLHDRIIASGIPHITVYSQDTGFGNQVATVCGDDFSLIPCHILSRGIMPAAAKYKIKACENNPGDDYGQQSLFTPPYAEKYGSISRRSAYRSQMLFSSFSKAGIKRLMISDANSFAVFPS